MWVELGYHMTDSMAFGEWLQRELDNRGWDQAELSRRSGISSAQVSRIVTGGRQPGKDSINGIARALRLPPEEVLRQAGVLPPKNANLTPGDRRALVETMDKIAALSHDSQRLVFDLVDRIWRSEER